MTPRWHKRKYTPYLDESHARVTRYLYQRQIADIKQAALALKYLTKHGRECGLALDREFGDLESALTRYLIDNHLSIGDVRPLVLAAYRIQFPNDEHGVFCEGE